MIARTKIKILLFEDNPGDARLINEYLKDNLIVEFSLVHVENLESGLKRLEVSTPDAILLDLGLPDSQGLDSLRKVTNKEPEIPVIVLTGLSDSDIALQAMQSGAQDYLIKGEINSELLARVIQYAIERKQSQSALQKSKKLLSDAERISHSGAWEWDIFKDEWTISEEWMRIHGVGSANFSTQQLLEMAHPDDQPAIQRALDNVINQHKAYEIKHRIIRADNGEIRIVHASGEIVFDQSGNPTRLVGFAQDITERIHAEENLRILEKRSRALVEHAPDGTVLVNAEGLMIYASPAARRIFGYEQDDELTLDPNQHTHPDDLSLVYSVLSEIIQFPEKTPTIQYRFKHKNGNWLWIESTFTNLFAEPSVQAIVINFRDITLNLQLEKELQQQEANLRKAQQVAHVGSWVWHISSNQLEWSDEMYNIFGLNREEFTGNLNDVIQRSIHPDDLDLVQKSNLSVINEGKPIPLEYRIIHPDGSQKMVWAEAGEMQRDENGNPIILSGIVMDITDRKQVELDMMKNLERLRSLYEITQNESRDIKELLDYALNAAIQLTESKIGYIYYYNEESQEFTLNTWSNEVMAECAVQDPQSIYQLEKTGYWGEAVRQRKPIINNDFQQENSLKKGFPEGHNQINKFLTIPLIQNQSILAVVGVANKLSDYNETDVLQISLLMDSVWKYIEQVKAEEELRQSEIRFRQVVENAPDAIYVQTNGRIVYLNPTALKLFGAAHESEILNKLDIDCFDTQFHEMIEQRIASINNQRITLPIIEIVALKVDGTRVDVDVSAVPIQWEGNNGALVFLRDISERKQSEQTLRLQSSALEAAANAIMITNREGIIQWVNPAWSKLSGFTAQEAIGKTPRISKSSVHDSAFYEQMWQTILSGNVFQTEMTNLSKDGRIYQEDAIITPLLNNNGQVTHFIAVKQDITERKKSEKQLLEKTFELNKRNEQLTRLYHMSNNLIQRSTLDPDNISQLIIESINSELQDIFCCVYLLDPAEKNLHLSASNNNIFNNYFPAVNDLTNTQLYARVAKSHTPNYIQEIQPSEDARAFHQDTHAVMLTPLVVGKKIVGVINIESPQPYFFNPEHEQFLKLLSNQAAIVLENSNLISEIKKQINRLESLRKIDETINASLDLHITADVILAQILQQMDVDAANFLVFESGSNTLNFVSNLGFHSSALQFSNVRLGQGLAGQAANSGKILHVADLLSRDDFLQASPQLIEEHFVEYFGVPLIAKGKLMGLIEIFNRTHRIFDESSYNFMVALSGQAAIAVENIELFQNLQKSINELIIAYDENIEAWSHALDLRDKETEGHTQRVEKITLRIAKSMGIKNEELVQIRRGALLHDIGKMGIPDHILLKPGPLSDEEWVIMRKHPVYAYELLSPIAFLKPALDIPYCHHEKWDGSGYPRGLKGEQIPLAARIFAIVDVWDALRSDRPYRAAWPEMKTMEYIREQAGTHFDPAIVELFLNSYIFEDVSIAKPTILIVDDEENVTRSLARTLRNDFVVLTANSGKEAYEIVRRSNPMVVLTDQRMPGMTGVELLENIRKIKPEIVGILISGYSDVSVLITLVNLGNVSGFIPKPWDYDFLRKKLDEAVRQYREAVRRNQESN